MKKSTLNFSVFSLLFLISPIFLSCSSDNESNQNDPTALYALRSYTEMPANNSNPYDGAGKIHNEILYAYYLLPNQPRALADIIKRVDSIAASNGAFKNMSGVNYHGIDSEKISYILSQKITCSTTIINHTGLTVRAKSSLSNFISAVVAFSTSEDEYAIVYDFITDYEADVLKDPQLTEKDKEVMLTISSVARHSVHAKKKRPKKNTDPDWDVMVGNIIASTEGSGYSIADAITWSLAAGIAENQ